MVPFAGFEMPVQYTGVNEEHRCVLVLMFLMYHYGRIFSLWSKCIFFNSKNTFNDASLLLPGKAQYAYLPNTSGGIVDDMIIYMISDEEYMLVVYSYFIELEQLD